MAPLSLSGTACYQITSIRIRSLDWHYDYASAMLACVVAFGTFHDEPIYGSNNYLTICWIQALNLGRLEVNPFIWGLLYVPLMIIFVVCIVCLWQVRQKIRAGLSTTARLRLEAFRQTLRCVSPPPLTFCVVNVQLTCVLRPCCCPKQICDCAVPILVVDSLFIVCEPTYFTLSKRGVVVRHHFRQ